MSSTPAPHLMRSPVRASVPARSSNPRDSETPPSSTADSTRSMSKSDVEKYLQLAIAEDALSPDAASKVAAIQTRLAANAMLASDLLGQQHCNVIPTKISAVDQLLGGGLTFGRVAEIVGESACGKTQLCHIAAAVTAEKLLPVCFIDSKNSFAAMRIRRHLSCGHTSAPLARLQPHEMAALKCITVQKCFDIESLLQILSRAITQPHPRFSLVVLDSVTALLSSASKSRAVVYECKYLLRRLALERQCCVLLTNDALPVWDTSGNRHNTKWKPALGHQWVDAPHIRLHLHRKIPHAEQPNKSPSLAFDSVEVLQSCDVACGLKRHDCSMT